MNNKKHNNLLKQYNSENKIEIGIDEVGRGPLFGRVYSAGVILPKNDNFKYELLKDSKKFSSKKKITEVSHYIKSNVEYYSIQYVDENNIDRYNIKNASHTAMHLCIKEILANIDIKNFKDILLLIDGNNFKPYTYLYNDNIHIIDNICIEGGDNKYCSIAAASIIAKVERDKYIEMLCKEYPKLDEYYDLNNNKGYGTKRHIEGIQKYGISPWHRTTYSTCKNIKKNDRDFYK